MDKTSFRVLTLTVGCMLFLSTTAQQAIAWPCNPPACPTCYTCTPTGCECLADCGCGGEICSGCCVCSGCSCVGGDCPPCHDCNTVTCGCDYQCDPDNCETCVDGSCQVCGGDPNKTCCDGTCCDTDECFDCNSTTGECEYQCHPCKTCDGAGNCIFPAGHDCTNDSDCGSGRHCPSCECVCDITQCGDDGDCVTYSFAGELSSAQSLLQSALSAIPCVTVSNVNVSGSVTGTRCPCCPSPTASCVDDGTATGSGSATVSATLTGNIPGLSWAFDFDYKGFGVYGVATFSPQLTASPVISGSIDVFKRLNEQCSPIDTCITVTGCAGVSVELALHAEVTAGMHLGWWDVSLTMMAHAGVTASAAAWVEYASPQCIPPGTTTDACLGDIVGLITVDILGWEWESDPYTFYDGDDDCGCS